ncbi:MAG: hypothetical protein K2K12_03865, partial [Clostridia bacterium]|nr:hypothetical protein [Clostridia bacterium]
YTATVTLNSTKYKWADSSSFTSDRSRTFKFKIEPKKIEVKVQDSDSDGIPDKVDCDATQMLGNPADSVPNFTLIYGNTIGGNDFASVPTHQGTYYATAKITDTVCNYEIDTSKTTYYLQFSVKGAITKPYFKNDSGSTTKYTDTAKYTGSDLSFDLNGVNTNVQVTAQGSGISVNGSSLVVSGGVGTYKATVSLVNASDNKWSDNTTASYDLEIEITKGDYDFTKVKWQYKSNGVWVDFPSDNSVTYTGSAIDMQVTGLPTGLSVLPTSYTGTGNTNADDYTAQVTNLNGVDAVNYNAVTVSSITEFTFKYTIKKKQVNIGAWSNTTQTSGGNSFTIPTLPADNAYEVVYYVDTDWDTVKNEPKSGATALSASQITYSSTASQNYYAYAQLSSNVNYQNNYELTGTLFQQFSVGGGKTAVTLSVPVTSKTYDGTPFNVQADAADSGGSTVGLALDYTYYESDGVTQLSSAPTNAGSYVVKVAIGSANEDDYAIDGTSTFTFTINQATIDLSKLVWQWQYVGDSAWNNFSDGMPVFKKGYGVSTRVDTSNLPAGLSADDFDIQEEKPLPSSLGAHSTTIAFKPQLKDSNYVRPSDNTYSWQITKKIIKVTTWVPGVLPDTNGDEQGVKVVDCHEDYAGVLEYLYSFTYTDKDGNSRTVTDMAGAAALTLLYTYADAETVIPVTVRVDLTDTVNYEFSNDSVLSSTFNAGDGLEKVTIAVTGSGSTYGDVNLGVTATLKDGSSVNGEFYTVKLCDKNGEVLKELAADDLNDPANYRDVLKDAGDYIIKVALTELGEKNGYYLSGATSEYKIVPKEISAPVIAGTVSFTGSDID